MRFRKDPYHREISASTLKDELKFAEDYEFISGFCKLYASALRKSERDWAFSQLKLIFGDDLAIKTNTNPFEKNIYLSADHEDSWHFVSSVPGSSKSYLDGPRIESDIEFINLN